MPTAGPSGGPDNAGAVPVGVSRKATGAAAPDRRLGSGKQITLAFGGDVHFEGVIAPALDADPGALLEPVASLLAAADVAMVNLETAVTERGSPADKEFTFRAPETAFDALSEGGVDVATLANNHGVDFGREGLDDTLTAAAEAGPSAFPLVGVGGDAETAYQPWTTTVRGQRLAVFGATQVLDAHLIGPWSATDSQAGIALAKDPTRLVEAIQGARRQADTVVVYLHWGAESMTCPTDRQRSLAQALKDAGADIIVGSHAHRLQGAGRLGDSLVAYGLGNFVFYAASGPATDSGVLTVSVTGRRIDDYRWEPARIESGVPNPIGADEADDARADWDSLRDCTGLEV